MNQPTLAYVETSLPAASQAEHFAALQRWGMALEIANQGDISVETYQQAHISIVAVQAYQMHEFHPLHRDPTHRQQAQDLRKCAHEIRNQCKQVPSNYYKLTVSALGNPLNIGACSEQTRSEFIFTKWCHYNLWQLPDRAREIDKF